MAEKKDGYAPAMVMARCMFNVLEKSPQPIHLVAMSIRLWAITSMQWKQL